ADVLLMPPVPDAAFEALKTAVRTGRIPRSRLDESVRRILRAKARLGLHRERLVPLEGLNSKFGLPDWSQAAQEMSDRGVTLLRDTTRQLPLDATRPTRALLVVIAGDPNPYLIERFPNSSTWLAVFGNSDVSQRSAARALFGQVAISGRLPVGIPGVEGGGLKAGEGLAVPANPMRLWPASDSVKARLKPV